MELDLIYNEVTKFIEKKLKTYGKKVFVRFFHINRYNTRAKKYILLFNKLKPTLMLVIVQSGELTKSGE
jgi:hypothetical protein